MSLSFNQRNIVSTEACNQRRDGFSSVHANEVYQMLGQEAGLALYCAGRGRIHEYEKRIQIQLCRKSPHLDCSKEKFLFYDSLFFSLVTFLTSLERRVIIIRRTRGNRPCFCATSDRSLDLVRLHKKNFKIMKNLLESPLLSFSKLNTNIEQIKIIKRSKSLTLSFSNYPRN